MFPRFRSFNRKVGGHILDAVDERSVVVDFHTEGWGKGYGDRFVTTCCFWSLGDSSLHEHHFWSLGHDCLWAISDSPFITRTEDSYELFPSSTGARTSREVDDAILPIYLGVVLLQPRDSNDHQLVA